MALFFASYRRNRRFLLFENRCLSKRVLLIIYRISVSVIKMDNASICGQDDRKRLIAVKIDDLNCVAIIDFQPRRLRLIHRDEGPLVIPIDREFRDSPFNSGKTSAAAKEISEGKTGTIYVDRKSMIAPILGIGDIGCHRIGNISLNDPILWNLL